MSVANSGNLLLSLLKDQTSQLTFLSIKLNFYLSHLLTYQVNCLSPLPPRVQICFILYQFFIIFNHELPLFTIIILYGGDLVDLLVGGIFKHLLR